MNTNNGGYCSETRRLPRRLLQCQRDKNKEYPSTKSGVVNKKVGKDRIISFKKLANGRYQCSICSKTVQKQCIPPHKIYHLAGKPLQCPHCSDSFRRAAHLREHTYSKHRPTFFAKHKEPNLTPWQFEVLVAKLFGSIDVPKVGDPGDRVFACLFCGTGVPTAWSRGMVQTHWIRYHLEEELVPRLLELQKNYTPPQPVPPPPPPPVELATLPPNAGGNKRFYCNLCSKSFSRRSDLQNHKFLNHRSALFAKHKEPSLTWEQFEALLATLFKSIEIPRMGSKNKPRFKCSFCDIFTANSSRRVRTHIFRDHMEQLVARLKGLQKKEVLVEGSKSKKSPGDNNNKSWPSSSSANVVVKTGEEEGQKVAIEDVGDDDPPASEPNLMSAATTRVVVSTDTSAGGECGDHHHQNISFKRLPTTGRYQCSRCGMTVSRNSLQSHRITHSGRMSFKCNACAKSFQHHSSLLEHKHSKHRSSFFAKHKHLASEEEGFEALLDTLFEDIPVPKVRSGQYSCIFCKRVGIRSKDRVQNHWIVAHMDQLEDRLVKLQKMRTTTFEPKSEIKKVGDDHHLAPVLVANVAIEEIDDSPAPADEDEPPNLVITSVKSSINAPNSPQEDTTNFDADIIRRQISRTTAGGGEPEPPFKCNLCNASFQRQTNLVEHKLWKHRSTFFHHHKAPNLSSEQFETLLETLFESIPVPRLRPGAYSCMFCACGPMKRKGRVQNHWVRLHMGQLVPRLMELQGKNVAEEAEERDPGSPSENQSSSSSPSVNVHQALSDASKSEEEETPNLVVTSVRSDAAAGPQEADNSSNVKMEPRSDSDRVGDGMMEIMEVEQDESNNFLRGGEEMILGI